MLIGQELLRKPAGERVVHLPFGHRSAAFSQAIIHLAHQQGLRHIHAIDPPLMRSAGGFAV